jgi:hypothetical protein
MTLCVPQRFEQYRLRSERYTENMLDPDFWASDPGDNFGAFKNVPGPCDERLNIVVSGGMPDDIWEHVSVSLARVGKARLPNWEEMQFVKNLFWHEEDCVVQFHPPKSEYVNNYRVLHLWRSPDFPRPPGWMIGIKALGYLGEEPE